MHYYSKNIADYRKDTAHLTLVEHGIYCQLIDTYYLDEKPIETQVVIRRLSIKTQDEVNALNNVLSDFFDLSDCGNFYTHGRIEHEIARYKEKAEIAKANGSKGGRPKKAKKTQRVNSANPEITKGKANQEPITINQEPITNNKNIPSDKSDGAPVIGKELSIPDKPKPEKPKVKRFVKPSLDEISAYCQERNNFVDAEKFKNYYDSNGWKVGKNPMKDWKASIRTWESNSALKPIAPIPSGGKLTRDITLEEDLSDRSWAN